MMPQTSSPTLDFTLCVCQPQLQQCIARCRVDPVPQYLAFPTISHANLLFFLRLPLHQLGLRRGALALAFRQTLRAALLLRPFGLCALIHALGQTRLKFGVGLRTLERRVDVLGERRPGREEGGAGRGGGGGEEGAAADGRLGGRRPRRLLVGVGRRVGGGEADEGEREEGEQGAEGAGGGEVHGDGV